MLTYSDLQLKYQDMTNDDSAANLTFGKAMLNYANNQLNRAGNFTFSEVKIDITSAASDFDYSLHPKIGKVKAVTYIVSSNEHPLIEITSQEQWNNFKAGNSGEASIPTHFFPFYGLRELWLHPTPSVTSDTIRLTAQRRAPQFDTDDYTTGTGAFVNGDATVTGTTTVYTDAMVGRFIEAPDGHFYEILSKASDTSIELTVDFDGITESSFTTKIGQVPLIPEEWQDGIWQYAVSMYEAQKGNTDASTFYLSLYEKTKNDISEDSKNKTTQQVMRDSDIDDVPRSVNDFPVGPL